MRNISLARGSRTIIRHPHYTRNYRSTTYPFRVASSAVHLRNLENFTDSTNASICAPTWGASKASLLRALPGARRWDASKCVPLLCPHTAPHLCPRRAAPHDSQPLPFTASLSHPHHDHPPPIAVHHPHSPCLKFACRFSIRSLALLRIGRGRHYPLHRVIASPFGRCDRSRGHCHPGASTRV